MVGRLNLRVPEDISIVGYGDAPWWNTGLSTISLPVRDIALSCGDFLLRRIRERASAASDGQSPVYQATHLPTLVLRSSTAPWPLKG